MAFMMFNMFSIATMACIAISLSRFSIGEESYGIAFRVSENGLNALLQEPIRILFREATKPHAVELKSVEVAIPENGKILAKVKVEGDSRHEISLALERDASGGLKFAKTHCTRVPPPIDGNGELCQKIQPVFDLVNKELEKVGTIKDVNGMITFHYPLLKDPEIVKGENGATSFAKFVVLGQSFATEKNTKPQLNANIQDTEMDKTLADKDIVFEVTSLVIDSFIQALLDAGVTENIPLDFSILKRKLEWFAPEDAGTSERLQQIADDAHNLLATSCQNSQTSCLGKYFGMKFQKKYPNDSFAFQFDVTKVPAVKISPAGIDAEIAANVEFKLESTGAHLFNLLIEVGAKVSNASIADGRVFLVATPKAPVFKIENDETGGLVGRGHKFSGMWNLQLETWSEKLAELSTTGIEIPEIPFVKIESAEMITLENRLYFVVDKAAIQIPNVKTQGA